MLRFLVIACLAAAPAWADVLVPTSTLRAKTVINAEDLLLRDGQVAGALSDPSTVIGMEARVTLYAGRPIRSGDLRAPAVISRNQLVKMHYQKGTLIISTDGRALDRAAPGEVIKVMNLTSKATLAAKVQSDGSVLVIH